MLEDTAAMLSPIPNRCVARYGGLSKSHLRKSDANIFRFPALFYGALL
jgi:hypothetical protein